MQEGIPRQDRKRTIFLSRLLKMILTPQEYSKLFPFGNKMVSPMTIKRRCQRGQLPSNHKARKLPGSRGVWVIEVIEYKTVQFVNTTV